MRPLFVVIGEELGDAVATGVATLGGVQIDVVVFERAPQALDEHVVDGSSHPVHRDCDAGVEQHAGERFGRELRALIRVEDRGTAVEGEGFVEGRHAEVTGHGVGHPPGEHLSRVPVHDRDEVEEPLLERDVGDVRAPHVVRSIDAEVPQQVGVFRMVRVGLGGRGLRSERAQTHELHESLDAFAVHLVAPSAKDLGHHPRAVLGVGQVEPVDLLHKRQIQVGLFVLRLVVVGGAGQAE